jgi:hypothetical protein
LGGATTKRDWSIIIILKIQAKVSKGKSVSARKKDRNKARAKSGEEGGGEAGQRKEKKTNTPHYFLPKAKEPKVRKRGVTRGMAGELHY